MGYQTLKANTSGSYNSIVGSYAAPVNTTGSYNAALGDWSLAANTSGHRNAALGYRSLGGITTGAYNIGVGYYAGSDISTGSNNTIIGNYSGTASLTDTVVIAAGSTERLKVNSTGLYVNGVLSGGASALGDLSDATTVGSYNLGLGAGALDRSSITGYYNIALGDDALKNSSTALSGWANIAIGQDALKNVNAAWHSIGIGTRALSSQVSTYYSIAIGYESLKLATAHYNVAIGRASGITTTTGTYNAHFGDQAQASSATSSNQFTLGSANTTNLRCNDTSISSLSDQRDKAEITDLPESAGLTFIKALRPVTYFWDRREWYDDGVTDGSKINRDWRRWKTNSGMQQGFVAQEVQTAMLGEKCLEDSMIVTTDNPDKLEFAPQKLLINAIKAIQQLSSENEALKIRLTALENA
jgi:hypothetical protein